MVLDLRPIDSRAFQQIARILITPKLLILKGIVPILGG